MSDPTIALGVTVFKRTDKLRTLLRSAEGTSIETVYVADDGNTEDRRELYSDNYDFDLNVIDLPYNAGLGRGRVELTQAIREDYVLIVDSDQQVPADLHVLVRQLDSDEQIGGISGLFLENGHISGMCHNLSERNGVLVRDTPPENTVRDLSGKPFVEFDFIPNCTLFRREVFNDYTWDPEYVIGKEHLDFYVGHKHESDWIFGVSPTVLFPHSPGGGSDFLSTRHDPTQLLRSKEYFLQKWGYRQVMREDYWLDHAHPRPVMMSIGRHLPKRIQPVFLDLNDTLWRIQGKVYDKVGELVQ